MASSKQTGNDLRMAIIEIAAKHSGPYDTAMIREVFDFCWDQLAWRATDGELQQLIDEMSEGLGQ